MTGIGWLPGNWVDAEKKTRKINLIEPVVEGILQLFFQSIVLYIVLGPSVLPPLIEKQSARSNRPIDLSSILYSESLASRSFYCLFLVSTIVRWKWEYTCLRFSWYSIFSVGISFTRLLTKGYSPVIKSLASFRFAKVLLMIVLKFMVQSYVLAMAVKSMMYKFVSKE